MPDSKKIYPSDGSTVAQPLSFPATEHKGHRADATAITRTKKRPLLRRYAAQKIAKIVKAARRADPNARPTIPTELARLAERPPKRKR